jgi:hypothetical protein
VLDHVYRAVAWQHVDQIGYDNEVVKERFLKKDMLYFYCCGLRGFFFFRMTDGAQDTKG